MCAILSSNFDLQLAYWKAQFLTCMGVEEILIYFVRLVSYFKEIRYRTQLRKYCVVVRFVNIESMKTKLFIYTWITTLSIVFTFIFRLDETRYKIFSFSIVDHLGYFVKIVIRYAGGFLQTILNYIYALPWNSKTLLRKERLGKISLLPYELYICNAVSSSLAPNILLAKCLSLADRNFSGTAGCVWRLFKHLLLEGLQRGGADEANISD
jgi:hypothetical protein